MLDKEKSTIEQSKVYVNSGKDLEVTHCGNHVLAVSTSLKNRTTNNEMSSRTSNLKKVETLRAHILIYSQQ